MTAIQVAMINASKLVQDEEAQAVLAALQTQVRRDFAPAWGIDAELAFVPRGQQPAPGAWWLTLVDESELAGGIHELTEEGLPLAKVFVAMARKARIAWSFCASHELLEMLANPGINLAVYPADEAHLPAMTFYGYQVCDPCQARAFGYSIDGVRVSDFVFPSWFGSFRSPGQQGFDFRGHTTKPFQLLKRGSIDVFDARSEDGWRILYPEEQADATEAYACSHRARRRTPRGQWRASQLSAVPTP